MFGLEDMFAMSQGMCESRSMAQMQGLLSTSAAIRTPSVQTQE